MVDILKPSIVIDSTGKDLVILVLAAGIKILRINGALKKRHSSQILEIINKALAEIDKTGKDIGCVGVVVGPGSFTGIRIGVATANALAKATGAMVVSINNLEVMLYGKERGVALIDCRNNNYYALVRSRLGDNHYTVLKKTSIEKVKDNYDIIEWERMNVDNLENIFLEKKNCKEFLPSAMPFYIRESSAERLENNESIYSIIKITQEYINQIYCIEKDCFNDPWSENSIIEELNHEGSIQILCHNQKTDKVIGYGICRLFGDQAEIMRIAVINPYRGAGFGGNILASMLKSARDAGAKTIMLEVASDNISAIRLYEKLGFYRDGRRKDYYDKGRDGILYRKDLFVSDI